MSNKLHVSWEDYFKLCDNVLKQLEGIEITDIIAVARGGLIPAQYIAYQHGVSRIHSCGISSYDSADKKTDNAWTYQDLPLFSDKQRVLIVDDVADTGHTLKVLLEMTNNIKFIKTASLHYKPGSIVIPDFYGQEVSRDTWIVYPYDKIQ